MKRTTIHKNLRNGLWSVGSPVVSCRAVIATAVCFPDLRESKNKQFLNCLNGGSRKVFAKAKSVNAYGFDTDGECSVYFEGGRDYVQFAEDIVNDIRLSIAACDDWHVFSQLKHHGLKANRIYFNPKDRKDTFFYTIQRGEVDRAIQPPTFLKSIIFSRLSYSDIVLFAPDGNAYALEEGILHKKVRLAKELGQ